MGRQILSDGLCLIFHLEKRNDALSVSGQLITGSVRVMSLSRYSFTRGGGLVWLPSLNRLVLLKHQHPLVLVVK